SCSAHRQSRWVARRERERKSLSRSPLASGLAQRRRPRGPRWWPRPPRSRHQAVLVRSRSGRTPEAEAEAETGAWVESEVPGPPEPRQQQQQRQIKMVLTQRRSEERRVGKECR